MDITLKILPEAYQEHIKNLSDEEKLDLVEYILQTMRTTVTKVKKKKAATQIHHLDNQLFGSIQLPDDFDYDRELASAMSAKYSI